MRKPLRDSWVSWRIKVTKELDEYAPEDLTELKAQVRTLTQQVATLITQVETLTTNVNTNTNNIGDIENTFNGLFSVIDYGAISANNNIEPILKEQ